MNLSGALAPGSYSLAVSTPEKEPVRFRITWTGDASEAGIWYYSDYVNISPTKFDAASGTQDFTVIEPGSPSDWYLLFMSNNPGSAGIDVYEGDAAVIIVSREISW
jgi:hypothetical protein